MPWRTSDVAALLVYYAWLLWPAALVGAPGAAGPAPEPQLFAVQALLLQGVPLLWIAWRLTLCRLSPLEVFAPARGMRGRRAVLLGLVFGLGVFVLTLALSAWLARLLPRWGICPAPQPTLQWLRDPATPGATRWMLVALAVIVAPVAEEAVFRGVLFPAVRQQAGTVRAALLTSILFALVHLHVPALIPLTLLGLTLCAGYVYTRNLLTPIVMHATLNGLNLITLSVIEVFG